MSERVCSVEDCERVGKLRRGWCFRHYQRWLKTGDTSLKSRGGVGPCAIPGCGNVHRRRRGMCDRHYGRWYAYGDPHHATMWSFPRTADIWQRFWSRVVVTDSGCWVWQGTTNPTGYGQFKVGKKHQATHRFAYEMLVGPIPSGLTLDHLCRNPPCVRPHHLEPVTAWENTRRGIGPMALNASKTECKRGHPFDDANTLIDKRGARICRACNRLRARQYADAKRST